MLGLPAKHNDVFHCFFEGALPGRARFARSNTSSLQTHQKLTFIHLVCLIMVLLGSLPDE